ncbi:MAG: FCD domain-containing protein [Eubacteriales bacterium]|nr:FCD domain-containing protein [Eubacteriales bacterium]
MLFTKIETPSLKETCVQTLLAKIISGELQPGDRLPPERDLAQMLCVSRSIVNQSVLELESMGFLKIQPRRGTTVCDYRKRPTPQSLAALMSYGGVDMEHAIFEDLMATRLLVERECARLACKNIFPETLAKMQTLADALEQAPDDPTDILYQFHYHLTQASGNSVYSMIFRGFEPVLCALMRQHYSEKGADLAESARLHRALLQAIHEGNEAQAEAQLTAILSQGVSVLERRYDTR